MDQSEGMLVPVVEISTPLNNSGAKKMLRQLCGLRGFPVAAEGFDAVARHFQKLVGSQENGQWLIDRILAGAEWFPAPIEMRRIFCKMRKPADGIEEYQADMSDFMGIGRRKGGDQ